MAGRIYNYGNWESGPRAESRDDSPRPINEERNPPYIYIWVRLRGAKRNHVWFFHTRPWMATERTASAPRIITPSDQWRLGGGPRRVRVDVDEGPDGRRLGCKSPRRRRGGTHTHAHWYIQWKKKTSTSLGYHSPQYHTVVNNGISLALIGLDIIHRRLSLDALCQVICSLRLRWEGKRGPNRIGSILALD